MADSILVVEDDLEMRTLLADVLGDAGYTVQGFGTVERALEWMGERNAVDLVITDLMLPGARGHELLEKIHTDRPELNVIVITAFGSIESAIEMVRAGAYDYLPKPFSSDALLFSVRRALEHSHLRRELARLATPATGVSFGRMVVASRCMRDVAETVQLLADTEITVLITGETGVGKEVVAEAIHNVSQRRKLVAVNCAALPEALLESELFGHEKGAFTGATQSKEGLFEAADKGTLLLDEIAELPMALQPKLLRALESGEVRRIGSTRSRLVDVRLIAATNRALEEEVSAGRFREDLYWRLNVMQLKVPPLRDRVADIPLLAEHFLSDLRARGATSVRAIQPAALALLTAYDWPGNVRELRNVIERTATLSRVTVLRPEDLPSNIQNSAQARRLASQAWQESLTLHDLERVYILEVLRRTGGNKTRSAEILGLDRKTLYRKLEEYNFVLETKPGT